MNQNIGVLLSGRALRSAVQQVLKGGRALCAVAFWGTRSETLIADKESKDVRIICNLTMGGTNPQVIERMCMQGVKVKQCKTLHAKVYIGDHEAVLTSANASINGLGLFSSADAGWIEAGTIIPASAEIDWFEELWAKSREIRVPADIDEAMKLFSRRTLVQVGRPVSLGDEALSSELEAGTISQEALAESRSLYHGLSVRRAATRVLQTHLRPLKTKQIADELQAGGLATAAGVQRSVHDALKEGARAGKFVRVALGTWALTTWPDIIPYEGRSGHFGKPKVTLSDEEKARRRKLSLLGLAAARDRGVVGGRPRKINNEQVDQIVKRYQAGEFGISLAKEFNLSPNGLYRILKKNGASRKKA